jgi:hypothetical protein
MSYYLSAVVFSLRHIGWHALFNALFSTMPKEISMSNTRKMVGILLLQVLLFVGLQSQPTNGLVAYYPFNGNANDESGNGFHGTVLGAVLTNDRFGVPNRAYYFNGSSLINIPEVFPANVEGFTVSAWVKPEAIGGISHTILYKGSAQGEMVNGLVGSQWGSSVKLANFTWYGVNTNDTPQVNRDYHVVTRYRRGVALEQWIDGVLLNSVPLPSLDLITFSGYYSSIGSNHRQVEACWQGAIDDIRIYNRALSEAEIASLYHEGGWNPSGNIVFLASLRAVDAGGQFGSVEYGVARGATDGLDTSFAEYELPPVPPAGAFDIRWQIAGTQGTDRDLRDTLGGTRYRTVFRGLVQPGQTGYPITLKWNHSLLPSGSFTLRDGYGGGEFSLDMKSRDSLVITNSDIGAFQILYEVRSVNDLYVRDAIGRKDTLQHGTAIGATDGFDPAMGEYELPPIPPTGGFDARWQVSGLQGVDLDLRDTLGGTRTHATYKGYFQPTDGAYPVTLSWNKLLLPPGSSILRDASGGSAFWVDMKRQDSLVISNPDISTFQITRDTRPVSYYTVQPGWNILSVPFTVDDRRKTWLYPGANSFAFTFGQNGYVRYDTLRNGIGYWVKFASQQTVGLVGSARHSDTISVVAGWNMIGAISDSIPTSSVRQNPPTIIASPFYQYGAGYTQTTSLLPSKGYWVKTTGPGYLIISNSGGTDRVTTRDLAFERASEVTISDATGAAQTLYSTNTNVSEPNFYELPPIPPAGVFDARFSTGRMLEAAREGECRLIPIQITSAKYPVTVSWDMKIQPNAALLMIGGREVAMNGSGSVTLNDPQVAIALRFGGQPVLPKEYALVQNYPNPFNPTTMIKYDLPKDSRVALKIFDVLGREVALLVSGEEKAGYKSVDWNASGFASGVYYYQLQAGEYTAVRKMLLIK